MRESEAQRTAPVPRLARWCGRLQVGLAALLALLLWDAWRPPGRWTGGDPVRDAAWLWLAVLWLAVLRRAADGRLTSARRRVTRRVSVAWSRAGRARRVALVLAPLCLGLQLWPLSAAPVQMFRHTRKISWSDRPAMSWRPSSDHVPPLVDHVVARPDDDPVLVRLFDEDPRAHQASYYCYPRLLVMDPAFRSWSTRWRQLWYDVPDPGFADPGPAPPPSGDRESAAARGLPAVLATPLGVVPLGPPVEPAP